jgi:choline kinase
MSIPDYRVVILGAGQNVRGDMPAAMVPVGGQGRLLDWLLSAFQSIPVVEIDFISGFMAEEVMRQYPEIRFHHNPDWARTGPAKSLSMAPLSSTIATFICYSDVVFRSETVERMQQESSDLVVAIDRRWKVRYDGRTDSELNDAETVRLDGDKLISIGSQMDADSADAEFAGLVKLSGQTAKRLQNVLTSTIFKERDGLPRVLTFLLEHSVKGTSVDVNGEWAELNAPQDLARFVLGTKAESLERLRPLVKSGQIGDLIRFTHGDWNIDSDAQIANIRRRFHDGKVIMRSSSLSEDSWDESAAGAFKSVPNVDASDDKMLRQAIEEVFASYGDDSRPENQILVQEMLTNVRMAGVVMTRTHGQGAPYYVINYDDTTGSTDSVTSGEGGEVKTLYIHRNSSPGTQTPRDLHRLMEAVRELEHLVGHDSLDIEFAITDDESVRILQVRPIAATHENRTLHDQSIQEGIRSATRYFEELQAPSPFLLGDFTQLSVMADWNPAEIVGPKPGRLAFSIYRYIITDETWATQRAEWGYRDVRPANLLVDILGHPYIDVRATFNSFIPAALPENLARRLVEGHLRRLAENPEFHDKVEFDVLFTCWSFDHDLRANRLIEEAGLDEEELTQLRRALCEITVAGIRRCERDSMALAQVDKRFQAIVTSEMQPLDRAFLHLENARQYGALHFAHLARAGFVAVTLLRSMVATGLIKQEDMEGFLASLRTVSGEMQDDAHKVTTGDLSWEDLVVQYGHLRPGTYDITSPRYDSAPEDFLRPVVEQCATLQHTPAAYHWDPGTIERIESELRRAGLDISFAELDSFIRMGVEGREYGKFIFTRDLSAALEALAEFGAEQFISRHQLAHIDLHALLAMRSAHHQNLAMTLADLARAGEETHAIQQAVCLPDQIFQSGDISCFEFRKAVPNYVTRKKVRAELVRLDQNSSPDVDLMGKIVLIPNADPGFDWIFSRDIAGLITMYGGANSHMAIRMAEFELPGVTGIGELLYDQIHGVQVVELDCVGRQIHIVR